MQISCNPIVCFKTRVIGFKFCCNSTVSQPLPNFKSEFSPKDEVGSYDNIALNQRYPRNGDEDNVDDNDIDEDDVHNDNNNVDVGDKDNNDFLNKTRQFQTTTVMTRKYKLICVTLLSNQLSVQTHYNSLPKATCPLSNRKK